MVCLKRKSIRINLLISFSYLFSQTAFPRNTYCLQAFSSLKRFHYVKLWAQLCSSNLGRTYFICEAAWD